LREKLVQRNLKTLETIKKGGGVKPGWKAKPVTPEPVLEPVGPTWKKATTTKEIRKQLTDEMKLEEVRTKPFLHGKTAVETKKAIEQMNKVGKSMVETEKALPQVREMIREVQPIKSVQFHKHIPMKAKNVGGDFWPDEKRLRIAMHSTKQMTIAKPKIGGPWTHNTDFSASGIMRHEIGHGLQAHAERKAAMYMDDIYWSKPKVYWEKNVSVYGATNSEELFAEAFCAYSHPAYGTGAKRLHKPIEDLMIKAFGEHKNIKGIPHSNPEGLGKAALKAAKLKEAAVKTGTLEIVAPPVQQRIKIAKKAMKAHGKAERVKMDAKLLEVGIRGPMRKKLLAGNPKTLRTIQEGGGLMPGWEEPLDFRVVEVKRATVEGKPGWRVKLKEV
jgi:hypothetical protein